MKGREIKKLTTKRWGGVRERERKDCYERSLLSFPIQVDFNSAEVQSVDLQP